MTNRPYLFEGGMKVVDIFSNVVTIKEVIKHTSIDCKAPQWNLRVEENGNTYVYYEIAGIYVKSLSKEETEKLLK